MFRFTQGRSFIGLTLIVVCVGPLRASAADVVVTASGVVCGLEQGARTPGSVSKRGVFQSLISQMASTKKKLRAANKKRDRRMAAMLNKAIKVLNQRFMREGPECAVQPPSVEPVPAPTGTPVPTLVPATPGPTITPGGPTLTPTPEAKLEASPTVPGLPTVPVVVGTMVPFETPTAVVTCPPAPFSNPLLLVTPASVLGATLMTQETESKSLGVISLDPNAADSLSNPNGIYGNKNAPDSIFNKDGKYGNRCSTVTSVFHPFNSSAPRLVLNGTDRGRLTRFPGSLRVEPCALAAYLGRSADVADRCP